ncbi:MAG TPA: class I SAM-dependent methyltransferase [Streptosporangiaceae bacterium]|nr:class I SAM-dependent methyltransferase [Streptosporangiaceae bacterium]
MTIFPADYDADPRRFLASGRYPHDDVHPYVADRFAAAGARTVLDVGGGTGKLARLLPDRSMRGLLVDLSPAMLELAPRPAVRGDGGRLPVADASVDAVALLYTLYHYPDALVPVREARRVLRPGGMLAACAPNRNSTPELAHILPGYGESSPFDGEDAAGLIASVFSEPGDEVVADPWDGPLVTLSAADHAAGFLRLHGMTEDAAQAAAAGLDLPLTLTMRGCCVYATKANR